jgi:hypothetical protein
MIISDAVSSVYILWLSRIHWWSCYSLWPPTTRAMNIHSPFFKSFTYWTVIFPINLTSFHTLWPQKIRAQIIVLLWYIPLMEQPITRVTVSSLLWRQREHSTSKSGKGHYCSHPLYILQCSEHHFLGAGKLKNVFTFWLSIVHTYDNIIFNVT